MIEYPHVDSSSLCIVGTKIPVRKLWAWHVRGTPIDTLLRRYPQLGPARVLSALAFAYDNLTEIEADIARAHHDELEAARDPRQLKVPF